MDEALALLSEHAGDAKALAGGQSLIPAMNFRVATPAVLVDLNALGELAYIKDEPGEIRIGGMTRQRALERSQAIAQDAPLIAETMPFIAHPAIRNRGTVGGSLAHADPAAELPAVMLALNAGFRLRSLGGTRVVPAGEFFTGLFSTAIEPGELLAEVVVSKKLGRTGFAFQEVSRRHGDFALVGVAASVSLDDAGRCVEARVALTSVGDRPVLSGAAARALIGSDPSEDAVEAAAAAVTADIDPSSDIHASAAYRRHLASVLTRRALGCAFARASNP